MTVVRVFWPTDIRGDNKKDSLLVGWQNSECEYVVIGCLNPTRQYDIPKIERAGHTLSVIGTLDQEDQSSSFSLQFTIHNTYPLLKRLIVNSQEQKQASVQIVLYCPLKARMQYLSSTPICISLPEKANKVTIISEEYDTMLVNQAKHIHELGSKIQIQVSRPNREFSSMETALSQIDKCHTVRSFLNPITHHKENKHFHLFKQILKTIIIYITIGLRVIAEGILLLLEYKIPLTSTCLKDISATAHQIDLRLQQFCFWPVQYAKLLSYLNTSSQSSIFSDLDNNVHAEHLRLFNSLWLIINDILIGVTLGSYIIENASNWVPKIAFIIEEVLINDIKITTSWLMSWPGGLKLNNEVARFLGDLFIWVINFWSLLLTTYIIPRLPLIISIFGVAGGFGATLTISLISDFISMVSFHIYCFSFASTRVYHRQLLCLRSLSLLFRGKKDNILRHRIDSCHYDLDQLLIGTIGFTVLIFLLPTVLVFYFCFNITKLIVLSLNSICETILAGLNHFPLFVLLQWVKDPKRVPGGVKFEYIKPDIFSSNFYRNNKHENNYTVSYLKLKNKRISLSLVFEPYSLLIQGARLHYFSSRTIKKLIVGEFVPIRRAQLYELLYNMLPIRRVEVKELWKVLKGL